MIEKGFREEKGLKTMSKERYRPGDVSGRRRENADIRDRKLDGFLLRSLSPKLIRTTKKRYLPKEDVYNDSFRIF